MRAILVGILAPSNCIRRVDSAVLQIIGLLLFFCGVCWKMWRELNFGNKRLGSSAITEAEG